MNRKDFFRFTGGLSGLIILPGLLQSQLNPSNAPAPKQTQDPVPPYKPDIVKEFVVAGHGGKSGDLDKVKSMLADYPNILYASNDWGNGDFEAAIEGAGHMGNKEMANYLIESGSRVTLFVLTMLGKTDLVKPILEAYPKLVNAIGPHGFTLLHHANKGGADSQELAEYLKSKGVTQTWIKIR